MCGVEIISLKSTSCKWTQTPDHHVWRKYTYTLCPTGVRRQSACDNAEPIDGQTGIDEGSARMRECPVCKKLEEADRVCFEKKKLADEEYARAYAEAFREQTNIYPLDSPPGPSRSRGGRETRRDNRHDSDGQHRNGGRGKRNDRDRYSHHGEKGKKGHDDGRGGAF